MGSVPTSIIRQTFSYSPSCFPSGEPHTMLGVCGCTQVIFYQHSGKQSTKGKKHSAAETIPLTFLMWRPKRHQRFLCLCTLHKKTVQPPNKKCCIFGRVTGSHTHTHTHMHASHPRQNPSNGERDLRGKSNRCPSSYPARLVQERCATFIFLCLHMAFFPAGLECNWCRCWCCVCAGSSAAFPALSSRLSLAFMLCPAIGHTHLTDA